MIKIYIRLLVAGGLTVSCVERYYIDEGSAMIPKIVVDGMITDQDSIQRILLSKTSSPEYPVIIPLSNCQVSVFDFDGDEFKFDELTDKPGVYQGLISASYLQPGNRFRLFFKTETGEEFESSFEEILPCPPVDSLYYEITSIPTSDPDIDVQGLQFYLDFKAPDDYGRYYRWELEETWEYHSAWPITMYWAGKLYFITPPDYSLFYCYKTGPVNQIFILSTNRLVRNNFERYKLHFVNNLTQKLMHHYSLLLNQYSISNEAYDYWATLIKNNQESGGLFDNLPALVRGNIHNIYNSDEIVLGYFSVSSVKSKRINLKNIQDLPFDNGPVCSAKKFEERFYAIPRGDWPYYLLYIENHETGKRVLSTANPECFDCTMLGGTTEKPSFFD